MVGSAMDMTVWIPTAILTMLLFASKNWIKASIEKSVQHEFDQKLEKLRTELRKKEEEFNSSLRAREGEISMLREQVLSGRASREALMDKRRLDAVERVWASVGAFAPYKMISASMAIVKFEQAAKRVASEPNLRKFFEIIASPIQEDNIPKNPARDEKPFVSPLAWAYLSAYQTILLSAYTQAKILAIGLEDAGKYITPENAKALLKVALPHQTEFIDKNETGALHYLLDELEDKLLAELRKMLKGVEIDNATVARSAEMMDLVNKITAENEKGAAEVASIDHT
jgi:hypothetical protein